MLEFLFCKIFLGLFDLKGKVKFFDIGTLGRFKGLKLTWEFSSLNCIFGDKVGLGNYGSDLFVVYYWRAFRDSMNNFTGECVLILSVKHISTVLLAGSELTPAIYGISN